MISSLLTIFFVFLIRWYLRHRNYEQYLTLFGPIIKVMEQIAKGNFNVRLDNTIEENEPLGNLVKSVNSMAIDLDELEKMRQEFISNVSHGIQSSLASIRGFAQVLKLNNLNPEDRLHYLSVVETESLRLSRLSDNLFKLVSLETENIKFEPKPYRLDKQIKNLLLACELQIVTLFWFRLKI